MEDDLARLEAVFGKVSPAKAHYIVNASAKIYPQFVKIFVPNNPYLKKIPFMEDADEDSDTEDWTTRVKEGGGKSSNETNLERSLRKTKTTITDLTLCNEFSLFATFTFSKEKSDRLNPAAVKIQMANWLRNQRKAHGKFDYLIVPEAHKKGGLHFHALINNYHGKLVESDKKHKGRKVYHFGSYTLGWNTVVKIDDIEKVSSYVRKYITKDMPQFAGQHRFWTSTQLKRPELIDNPDIALFRRAPLRAFTNDYGRTFFFPRLEGSDGEQPANWHAERVLH